MPQSIGRIYLLAPNGLNSGTHADVDGSGHFVFTAVATGTYLVRYWGDSLADVPEPLGNPVRVTVSENQTTVVDFQIIVGGLDGTQRDIFAGDFFFQEQPDGLPNAIVVVPLGTVVCWYNVGQHTHTVTGGPWGDSGPMAPIWNFLWTADQVGTFPYRCIYHSPDMQATLKVIPA
ncbi:MAG: cupredoxin domain-containing protein [Gemmatimonadaceae bacterium]